MKTALSATQLSRLHRQRRLESASPIAGSSSRTSGRAPVTPASIQRRSRNISRSISNDDAGKSLVNTSVSCSFDEEVTAANASTNNSGTPPSNNHHCRNLSFSSFSSAPTTGLLDTSSDAAGILSPPPPHTPSSGTTAAAVTPDSAASSAAYSSPPNPSPTTPSGLGLFLARGTRKQQHQRGRLSRSNSSKSMPVALLTNAPSVSSSNSTPSDSMPMDELMAKGSNRGRSSRGGVGRSSSSRGVSRSHPLPPSTRRSSLETPFLTSTTTEDRSGAASPTTLALLPSAPSASANNNSLGLNRMAQALQLQTCPVHMTADEQYLWDVVHNLLDQHNNTNNTASSGNNNSSTTGSSSYWEQKYKHAEVEWKDQQHESDRAVRAIQRVLADVTTEREQTVVQLQQDLERTQEQRDDTILKLTQKLKEMQQEMTELKNQGGGVGASVNNSSSSAPDDNDSDEVAVLKRQLGAQDMLDLRDDNEQKAQEIEALKQLVKSLQSGDTTALDTANDQDDLLQELQEKSASLENAKMIIASLENANGSLARELRAKLKEKEEELANLTSTSADRKRTLDSLATELRELQRQQQKPRLSQKQLANQKSLCQLLEKNVKALRQAAVQHEAQNDQSSVDQISHIVSETFTSLKYNVESWENYLKNHDVPELQDDASGAGDPHMESALAKKHDETKVLRKELERVKSGSSHANVQLKEELKALKTELAANLETLDKRGRELSVLRDSLNVEDNGNGYISDDGTDGYDEAETGPTVSPEDYRHNAFTGSLLLHGGAGVHSANPNAAEMSDATAAEIQMLKNEIIKEQKEREATAAELQAEKESLANAKMIISSLEKANKSMLEDLRSRLQDSNTAIASLLEKSMEHEKTIDELRKELDAVRQTREKDGQKAEAHKAKLRDENLVFSMRLAAKDRENEELHDALSQYEGQEVPISSKLRLSSVEEKKDDPASDDEN